MPPTPATYRCHCRPPPLVLATAVKRVSWQRRRHFSLFVDAARSNTILLCFTPRDNTPTVWFTDNGERAGTFDGHNGTIWMLDVTRDSKKLVTASADMSCAVWDVESGKRFFEIVLAGPGRYCSWAEGSEQFCVVVDPFRKKPSCIQIFDFASLTEENKEPLRRFDLSASGLPTQKKITICKWTALNKKLLVADELGMIRLLDPVSGEVEKAIQGHTGRVNELRFNHEKTLFITGASDNLAKLWDANELTCLCTYETEVPVNGVDISPIKEHVVLGGGQDAMEVTTTSTKSGKFEARFFHMVFAEEFGRVKGHFGPINTLAFHPNGTGFASGSEDGYIRLHKFDADYFKYHNDLDNIDELLKEARLADEEDKKTTA